jgi:hypothetical protein
MLEIHNARLKIEIFDKRSFDVFIEGFYKSSKNASQKITDLDEASSDDEDDADIAMIDEMFPQDDSEISPSSTKIT